MGRVVKLLIVELQQIGSHELMITRTRNSTLIENSISFCMCLHSSMFGWNRVSKVLRQLCLTKCPSLFIDAQQKFRCCFMLGKMAEKQQPMAITEALKYYLMAEQQLFDQQQDGDDDDNNNTDGAEDASLIQTKIEMNFRITASIYKFVARYMAGSCANSVNNDARAGSTATVATGIGANDDELLQQLMHVLQRDKSRLFTENQLAKRVKQMNELVDENANKVNGAEQQQQNRVSTRGAMCQTAIGMCTHNTRKWNTKRTRLILHKSFRFACNPAFLCLSSSLLLLKIQCGILFHLFSICNRSTTFTNCVPMILNGIWNYGRFTTRLSITWQKSI